MELLPLGVGDLAQKLIDVRWILQALTAPRRCPRAAATQLERREERRRVGAADSGHLLHVLRRGPRDFGERLLVGEAQRRVAGFVRSKGVGFLVYALRGEGTRYPLSGEIAPLDTLGQRPS